nr:T9SS type A sorting domain-containing protein [Bacteroidota bacterium]
MGGHARNPPTPARGIKCRVYRQNQSVLNSVTISIVDFKNENWELKIFDVMGKEVLQQKIVREKTDLDLRYLNRGIYFVMVYDGRSIFTEKVVKL